MKIGDFELFGQAFTAMSAGPLDTFNRTISCTVNCEIQAEIDRYVDALIADGGAASQCGWLKDRIIATSGRAARSSATRSRRYRPCRFRR